MLPEFTTVRLLVFAVPIPKSPVIEPDAELLTVLSWNVATPVPSPVELVAVIVPELLITLLWNTWIPETLPVPVPVTEAPD
jgi:hypothetical protein